MSRPKEHPLREQEAKLALLEAKLGWKSAESWCHGLDIQSPSTVSSWKKGNGISDRYKQEIISQLSRKHISITVHELISHSARDFGVALGLDERMIDSVLSGTIYRDREAGTDSDANIVGRYIGIYLAHSSVSEFSHALAIERFSIDRNLSGAGLVLTQDNNYVTRRTERGPLQNKDGRLLGRLVYKEPEYTDSTYILMTILVSEEGNIFYGVYLDITEEPVREIFATKFILMSWDGDGELPIRSKVGDELHRVMLPIVQNNLNDRARLVVEPPPYHFRADILSAVRDARSALERLAL